MFTSATARRLTHAVAALALAGPAVFAGGFASAAWADETPAPAATDVAPAGAAANAAAEPQPTIGGWIVGGTLLEGNAGAPAAKPAAKPVAKPAGQPVAKPAAPVRTTRTTTRTSTRVGTTSTAGTSTARTSTATRTVRSAAAPDGATALPFTGGHVEALLPVGVALLVGGLALTVATRPRRALA